MISGYRYCIKSVEYTRNSPHVMESIIDCRQLSSNLTTGGQPDRNQLHHIANAGYDVVINLGLADTEYAIPDEKQILESHGIHYIHIPVEFEAPEVKHYREFSMILNTLQHKKVFIHCAANKRVSVFIALFLILERDQPYAQATAELESCWQPNATWREFIARILADTAQ